MFFLRKAFIFLLIYEVDQIASNHGFCNRPLETIKKFDPNMNISDIEECKICTYKMDSENCYSSGYYHDLFEVTSPGKHHSTILSIESQPMGLPFCYFCISEYNASLRDFTCNDIVKVKYGDANSDTRSIFGKWETKFEPKRYGTKEAHPNQLQMKSLSGRRLYINNH